MKILVICSGGMSTSLLVKSMKNAAEAQNKNITIESGAVSDLARTVESCNVIMVAPQVRHRFGEIKTTADKYGKIAVVIEPQIYGLIDGKGALKQALDAVQK